MAMCRNRVDLLTGLAEDVRAELTETLGICCSETLRGQLLPANLGPPNTKRDDSSLDDSEKHTEEQIRALSITLRTPHHLSPPFGI